MTDPRSSQAFESLLALFEHELEGVPFPDLGVETLRGARAAVLERLEAVSALEDELARAREALEDARRAELRVGRKALAYARVYAEDRPELDERLAGLGRELAAAATPTAPAAEAPRRRGRPRKTDAAELFESPDDGRDVHLDALAS